MSKISKKPKTKDVFSEDDINALINKGGGVPDEPVTAKKPKANSKKVPVQLRLPQDLLDVIDEIIDSRVVKVSRHAWFLEAIAEKIEKER